MAVSYQDCLRLVKEAHPDLYPIWYIEKDGQYLFNMLKRGISKDEAVSSFYAVDTKSGEVSSSIPVMAVMGNESLADKLEHPHQIDPEDQKPLEHYVSSHGTGFAVRFKGSNNSLAHYGIKGQKWGVRRFQNEDRTLTPAGKERYYGTINGHNNRGIDKEKARAETRNIREDAERIFKEKAGDREMGFFEKQRTKNAALNEALLNNMERPTSKEVIDRSKTKQGDVTSKVAKDIAVTVLNPMNVAFLAVDGINAAKSSAKESSYLKKREQNSVLDSKTGLYMKKDGEYDEKQDLAAVNPRFMDMNSNSKNNCMLCTTTYDLRQRGYDVTAQMDSMGYTFGDLKRWYPKAKLERNSQFDSSGRVIKQKDYVQNTINSLKKQGEGARGNLMVFFTLGGGHSVAYEVKNGQLYIKDGQANQVYSENGSRFSKMTVQKFLNMTAVNAYARLDNVQPDLKMIKEECCR